MHINRADVYVGQPAFLVRKLLRQAQQVGGVVANIQRVLSVDAATAQQVFQALEAQGYIRQEIVHDDCNGDYPIWRNTPKGNALANASARKPISRTIADQLITEFLKRVDQVNADSNYAYQVKQVILFGSYLSDHPEINDIDLSILLAPRHDDPTQQQQHEVQRIAKAREAGRKFKKQSLQAWEWPQEEILRLLRGRHYALSFVDVSAKIRLTQARQGRIDPPPSRLYSCVDSDTGGSRDKEWDHSHDT